MPLYNTIDVLYTCTYMYNVYKLVPLAKNFFHMLNAPSVVHII